MSKLEKYAKWITENEDKLDTEEGKIVVQAYKKLRSQQKGGTPISKEAPQESPGIGSIAGGMATEIGVGAAGKYGGAAIGTAIAPGVGTLVGYGVGAISSGIAGSVAAQKIEGRETISWGRAIAAGLINLIPTSEVSKAAIKSGKVIKEAAKIGAKEGAITGAAEAQITSVIDTGKFASAGETAAYAGMGGVLGGGLGAGLKSLVRKAKGKTPDQIDESVAHNDITKEEVVQASTGVTKIKLYRGGTENPNSPTVYTSPLKSQAQQYDSKVFTYEVDANKIASEDQARQTLKELGFDVDEGMMHELVDPNFKDEGFYLGEEANDLLVRRLREKGFIGYKAEGHDVIKAGKYTEEVVLFRGIPDNTALESQVKRQVERSRNNFITGNSSAVIQENTNPSTGWMSKIYNSFNAEAKRWVAGAIPSLATGRRIADAGNAFDLAVKEAEALGSRVDAAINRKLKSDPSAKDKVNAFLDGAELDSSLEDISGILTHYRNVLTEQQDILIQMLDDDMIRGMSREEATELASKIRASQVDGGYVTREYRLFTDKNFEIDEAKYEAAIREVQRNMEMNQDVSKANRQNTRKAAKEYVDNLIAKSAKVRSVEPAGGYKQAIDSTLRVRHLDPEADKALMDMMGVITDPGERARGTLSSVGRMVARAQTENEIEEILLATGLGSTKFSNEFSVKLTGRSGKRDVYVAPETQIGINKLYAGNVVKEYSNGITEFMDRFLNTAIGSSKAAKVLFNIPSYSVQVWGNATTLLQMGYNPFNPMNIQAGAKVALSDFNMFNKNISKEMLEEIREAEKYGIKGVNILESDIRENINRGFKFVDKVIDPFAKTYAIPDTVGRYLGWKSTQEALKKIYKNADPEDIKRAAALLINDTYQNYSKLNPGLRELTRIGVMPQFASFTAEFARNQYYQGKHIFKLMKGTYADDLGINLGPADKSAMAAEGVKRMVATAGVFGATAAAMKGVESAHGVSQEMKAAFIESAMPEYDKNSPVMLSVTDEGKNYGYMNLSYIAPQALLMQAFMQGMDGTDETTAMNIIANEFIGEGSFVMKEAAEAAFNIDLLTGKQISVKENNLANIGERLDDMVSDLFRPGTAREIEKFKAAAREKGPSSLTEVGLRQIGYRVNKGSIDDRFTTEARKTYENASVSKTRYRSLLRFGEDRGMSMREIEAQYPQLNADYRASMQKLVKHNKNYMIWGRSEEERIQILKDAGIGSKDILSILNGQVPDLSLSLTETTAEKIEKLDIDFSDTSQSNLRSIKKKLKANFSDDPAELDRMISYTLRQMKKGKFTPSEQLLHGLNNRDKVDYLIKSGKDKNTAYLRELVQKGVISADVYDALGR